MPPRENPNARHLEIELPTGKITQELPDDDQMALRLVTGLLANVATNPNRRASVRPARPRRPPTVPLTGIPESSGSSAPAAPTEEPDSAESECAGNR